MNTRNRTAGQTLPTDENEKANKKIFQYQLKFCRMWIREFGVMPTRWIINDYSKQLTNGKFSKKPTIDRQELTKFTIKFINGYH